MADQEEKIVFIRLLEHGENVGIKGTNRNKSKAYVYGDNVKLTDDEECLFRDLFEESFHKGVLYSDSGKDLRILKTEYYFRLLEYRELKESRTASLSARNFSLWAICVSLAAIVAGFGIGYVQLTTPITINDEQVGRVVEAARSPVSLNQTQLEKLLVNYPIDMNVSQVDRIVEASQAPVVIQRAQLEPLIKALEASNTEQMMLNRVQFELLLKEVRSNRLMPAAVAGQEP